MTQQFMFAAVAHQCRRQQFASDGVYVLGLVRQKSPQSMMVNVFTSFTHQECTYRTDDGNSSPMISISSLWKCLPGTKVARQRMPRKAKKSSHHHCLWRIKRNTMRRTEVMVAATRNKASDASGEQRLG